MADLLPSEGRHCGNPTASKPRSTALLSQPTPIVAHFPFNLHELLDRNVLSPLPQADEIDAVR
jgi:hypothetical protein